MATRLSPLWPVRGWVWAWGLLALALAGACQPSGQTTTKPNAVVMDTVTIQQALAEAETWLQLPGVAGVAQGEQAGQPCLVVLATVPPDSLAGKIPATFRGFPVTFQNLGGPAQAQ